MKELYEISLDGCDDSTTFCIQLNKVELKLLKKVAKLSIETSVYSCMPRMRIKKTGGCL